jgi:hypothetical protein
MGKKAAQQLFEHISQSGYNSKNGKEVYDFVMKYINK